MALVNGSDYDHFDLKLAAGDDVARHMLKDAQARADVDELKSALIYSIADANLWESGGIASSDGGNSSSTLRIRTKTFLPKNFDTITPASGYKLVLYAYNANGGYVGCYNGSTFPKSATWFTQSIKLFNLPSEYYYRIVFANSSDSTISASDGTNCVFTAHTDISLTRNGVPADSKSTGDAIRGVVASVNSIGAYPLNLYNVSTLENGCYYSAGSRHTASNYSASDYIEVNGGATYCCARYTNGTKSLYTPIIEYYDGTKTYINWTNSKNIITFPPSAKYCRISSMTSDINGKQIVFIEASALTDMPDSWIPHSVDIKDLANIDSPNYQFACGDIICVGDSLTDGLYVPVSTGLIKQNYPYYLGSMLNATMVNAGKNGAPPDEWYQQEYSKYDFTNYDTAIVWLGTNGGLDISEISTSGTQCYYYKQIVDGIKAQNANIKILLATVFNTGKAHSEQTWPNVSKTNTAINAIAEDGGYQVVDMSDLAYANHPELHNNTNNTHFGKAGNIFIANRISAELKRYFNDNPIRCEFGVTQKT